jgi:CRISPR type III-A-associated RAMP protein Csm5
MNGYHRKYILHCEALSPIHIGSGEALSRWEYVVINNELYYVTNEFWELLLSTDSGAFDKLVSRINQSNSASLTEEFDRLPNKAGLKQTLKKSEMEFRPLLDKNRKPIIRSINRFAGTPNYYIPGSSLKGAFRGAYEISLIDQKFFQEQAKKEDYFLDFLSDGDLQELYRNIEIELKEYSKVDSNISEFCQEVRIKDISVSKKNLTIIPITFTNKEKEQMASELYECLNVGDKFKIEITYRTQNSDSMFFKINFLDPVFNFYATNFEELASRWSFSDYYHNAEERKKVREIETGKKVSFFRCGYGSGQVCNSVLSLWKKYSTTTKDQMLWQGKSRDLLKKGEFKNIDEYYYPSAPKRDISDEDQPLGWMMIDSIECRS